MEKRLLILLWLPCLVYAESTDSTLPHATDFPTLPDGPGGTTWYPMASASDRADSIKALKAHGYTHMYLSVTSSSHDFYSNPAGFKSLLQELNSAGIKPVVRLTSDTGSWKDQSISQINSRLDTFIPQIDSLVNSYCLGIEIDEYWSESEADEIGSHLDSLTSKPIAVHQLPGKWSYCNSYCDYMILQYGFGLSESQIKTMTSQVKSSLGKPVVAGEYNIDKSDEALSIRLGNAAAAAGAAGFGNGGTPSGQSCSDGCVLGARQCSGNGYQTCGNYDSDSCSEWSSVTSCPSGQSCSAGACILGCSNACVFGETQCAGTSGYQACGNFDSDSCTEWGSATACSSGQICSGGICIRQSSATSVKITAPAENASVAKGSILGFVATISDQDPSSLSFAWYLDRLKDGLEKTLMVEGMTDPDIISGSVIMSGSKTSVTGQQVSLEAVGSTYTLSIEVSDGINTTVATRSFVLTACEENWNCTQWSACGDGMQTRICVDANSCGSAPPELSRTCTSSTPIGTITLPAVNGTKIAKGSTMGFTAAITSPDSQTISYSWLVDRIGDGYEAVLIYNGTTHPNTVAGPVQMIGTRQSIKAQTVSLEVIGATYNIILTISDGVNPQARVVRSFQLTDACSQSDTDCDGCIRQDELVQFMTKWKGGQATLANLMEAIAQWKRGC